MNSQNRYAPKCKGGCGNRTNNAAGMCVECLNKQPKHTHPKVYSHGRVVRLPKVARQRTSYAQICGGGVRHINKRLED